MGKIEFPEWLPPEMWVEFKRHRVKIKKPMTEFAEKLNLGRLTTLKKQGHDPIKVIEQTIIHGYDSFWPLRKQTKNDNIGICPGCHRPNIELLETGLCRECARKLTEV